LAAILCYFTAHITANKKSILTIKNKVEVNMTNILEAMAAGSAYMGLV
jgi:hypothetical protein